MQAEETSSGQLRILEAIKSSKVIDDRIELINRLANSKRLNESILSCSMEYGLALWEDFTCLDMSHCMLYKSVLSLAMRYFDMDITNCLGNVLLFGSKASFWCRKHLEADDSFDECPVLIFSQLTLEIFSFSTGACSALTRSRINIDENLMATLENFILEQLHLAKMGILQTERIRSIASEVVKLSQDILDAIIKLCRMYSECVNWVSDKVMNDDVNVVATDRKGNLCHISNFISCTIETLYELGTFAASGGGKFVSVLNVAWKGLVALLQLGSGNLVIRICITDIVLTLISLASESLKCAAQAWSSMRGDTLDAAEAKRTFLPVKFYLINAVRICSQYPREAIKIHKEITMCIVMVSTFGIHLSGDIHLKAASRALVEFLEPTSLLLVLNLLNSTEIENAPKLKILDWLFKDDIDSRTDETDITSMSNLTTLDVIFTIKLESMTNSKVLKLGRLLVFLSLLRSSPFIREEVIFGMSKKLGCLLGLLSDPQIYSCILCLQIPVLCGCGPAVEFSWDPLFSIILSALKVFMVVAAAGPAWQEVEYFLLVNLLHPHFICEETITELFSFLMQHAEMQVQFHMIDGLCSLLNLIAASEPSFMPFSSLRRMARSVCTILSYVAQTGLDCIYSSLVDGDKSQAASVTFTALLVEGFPVALLSSDLKNLVYKRALSAFYDFLEDEDKILVGECSSTCSCRSVRLDLPVHALLGIAQSLKICNLDEKDLLRIVKFSIAVTRRYSNCSCYPCKERYARMVSHLLGIIANTECLFSALYVKDLIVELHALFVSSPLTVDDCLNQSKPALAAFMMGLSQMELEESDENAINRAGWELYQMLLKERNWSLIHLTLVSFGYFAARTSCSQLWKFLPPDAALSFDVETGTVVTEERLMTELKQFLEKERAAGEDEICEVSIVLANEGCLLNEKINENSRLRMEPSVDVIDVGENHLKRRKPTDMIGDGVCLLHKGLTTIVDAVGKWCEQDDDEYRDIQHQLSSQLSHLEDVISYLSHLAGSA